MCTRIVAAEGGVCEHRYRSGKVETDPGPVMGQADVHNGHVVRTSWQSSKGTDPQHLG